MQFDPFRAVLGPVLGPTARAGYEYVKDRVAPEPQRPQPRQQPPPPPRTPASHPSNPTATTFQNVPRMNPVAQGLYNEIRAYPNTKASETQAREIAIEVEAASRAFGIDPKVMLSIIAHESGGFDPRAESHSGAKGLGQLTGVAIQEMRRLSYDPTYASSYPRSNSERQHYSDPEIRALVERPNVQAIFQRLGASEANRYDISDNIWGSAFYARISMDRAQENRSGEAIVLGANGMMGRYNGADPAERRAHSAGVANAYENMFAQDIPDTLRPIV